MADRYWIGGTGNWNDTAHWSTSTGGGAGASIPTSSDNVYFDGSSGAGIATVNIAAACSNINFTGYTGTFAGSSNIAIYGTSAIFDSGATYTHSGYIISYNTAANLELTSGGASLACLLGIFTNAKLKLMDNVSMSYSGTNSAFLKYGGATFDTNGKKVTYTGLTIYFDQAVSFYDLTFDRSGATGTGDVRIRNANVSVTNSLVATGYDSYASRMVIQGWSGGSVGSQPLTVASATFTNVSIQRITAAGAFDWDLSAMTSIEDRRGNTGITFPTANTYYWYGAGSNLLDATRWYTGSGGTGSNGVVPLAQDNLIFDSSSMSGPSQTITMPLVCHVGNLTFAGVNHLPTLSIGGPFNIYKSLVFDTNMNVSGTNNLTFYGTGTFNSVGKTIAAVISFLNFGETMTLASNLTASNHIYFRQGTIDANDFDLTTTGAFVAEAGATVYMGNGSWETSNGGLNMWQWAATTYCEQSTIKLTGILTANRDFQGGGKTYYNFANLTTGDYAVTVTGNNTFNNFYVDAGRKQYFANGATNTVATMEAVGAVGNLITLKGVSAVTNLVKSGGGTITVSYCDVSYTNVTPLETWFAEDSLDSGNNTGWGFIEEDGGYFAMMLGNNF